MKNLKRLREEYGISQQSLAEQIGSVSQQSIHKYENGLAEPDIGTLIKFADFFDTTIDFLVGNSEIREKRVQVGSYVLDEKQLNHLDKYLQLSSKYKNIIDVLIRELSVG